MNADLVKQMKSSEMVKLYNERTGKSIKRFSSRAAGERLLLAALSAQPSATRVSPRARLVRGSASRKIGRPTKNFLVTTLPADKAASKLHDKGLRKQLIDYLATCNGKATIEAIDKHFKRNMRGVVNKLVETKWLACAAVPVQE